MSFLLDTNILSAHIKRPGGLTHRFIQHGGRLATTTITVGELYAGAYMLGNPVRLLTAIEELLKDLRILPFDADSAKQFGQLRGRLHRQGIQVSPLDLQIAAVATLHDLTLITNNTKDFRNIPDLKLDDWLRP